MAAMTSEHIMEQFSELVCSKFGICFKNRMPDLHRAVRIASPSLGFKSFDACAEYFLSTEATFSHWDTLLAHLTIGESFFFRDQRLFQHLKNGIIPEILQRKTRGHETVNVWSAGCANGQEPYSLAILFDQIRPLLNKHKISVMASDINPSYLEKAREGIYDSWSFRGLPHEIKDRYFTHIGSNRFAISPGIKSRVVFFRMNLMEPLSAAVLPVPGSVDLLLCRNVLMYFSGNNRQKAMNILFEAMSYGGYFIPASSEAGHIDHEGLTPVRLRGLTCFRKCEKTGHDNHDISSRMFSSPDIPVHPFHTGDTKNRKIEVNISTFSYKQKEWVIHSAETYLEKAQYRECLDCLRSYPGEHKDSLNDDTFDGHVLILMARAEAGLGNIEAALALCRKAIESDKFNPGYRYLLSVIHQESGNPEAAMKSLKGAVFLDPTLIVAHVSLGHLSRMEGKISEARKHFDNAVFLTQRLKPESMVPYSENMTASALLKNLQAIHQDKENS